MKTYSTGSRRGFMEMRRSIESQTLSLRRLPTWGAGFSALLEKQLMSR